MKGIIEIDIPENCIKCNLVVHEGLNIIWCCVTKQTCQDPYNSKNINCPLKEIE